MPHHILPFDDFALSESVAFSKDITKNYDILKDAVEKSVKLLSGDKPLGGEEFLVEIAMVETYLATLPNTVRTTGSAGRGAWQLDKVGFEETKAVGAHPSLKLYIDRLKKHGIDWMNTEWNECNQPLIGAIAARLLIAIKPCKIGKTVEERGKQWKQHYNSALGAGNPKEYVEKVETCKERLGDHALPGKVFAPHPAKSTGGLVNFVNNKGEKTPNAGLVNFISNKGKKAPATPASGLSNFIQNKGEEAPVEPGGLMNFAKFKGKKTTKR